jgi:butyrate kinase
MKTTEKEQTDTPDQPLQAVADLVEMAGRLKTSSVIIPGGTRIEDLRLVEAARDQGIIDRVMLVGNPKAIEAAAQEAETDIGPEDIVAADTEEEIARATINHISAGNVDVILKGNISTAVLNRHMLGMAQRNTVTLTSLFDAIAVAQGRPMLLTDAGFTTVCNFGRMVDMIRNAVDVAQAVMGIARPRVAILSANEKQIASLPSTHMGLELSQRHWPDAIVCGPLSFDLATSKESVDIKGMPKLPGAEQVAGQADILVCPGIDAANILYKTITALTKYGMASLAGITVGFSIPYVILSRSDALETRLNSIALSCIYAQRTVEQRPKSKPVAAAQPTVYRVLTVNPGSTSIKVAVFDNDRCTYNIEAPLAPCSSDPLEKRLAEIERIKQQICAQLTEQGIKDIQAVSGRGGFLARPREKLTPGTYWVAEPRKESIVVDDAVLTALLEHPEREHVSNLGAPLCAALARHFRVPGFMVDPVVVDEFSPLAEISGYKPIVRQSTAHVLSIRMASERAAQAVGRDLANLNFVVAHLGGGMTIASVCNGKIVDNTIGLLGAGPFTPCRTGQLPMGDLIDLCFSGRFTREELMRELTLNGGLRSYLGEHRMEIIEERIAEGDTKAQQVVEAMIYQISKEIGAAFVAAGCDVEAIVLTGGLARSQRIRSGVRRRVGRLAPVLTYEGSLEMDRLAQGARDVLTGRIQAKHYQMDK